MRDDEPMCMQTVVPVSSHSRKNGSQNPEWIDGRPRCAGISLNATARTPRTALRRTSAAARSASHNGIRQIGISRPDVPAHHSSTVQSLYASTHASPNVLSLPSENVCPQKRGKVG